MAQRKSQIPPEEIKAQVDRIIKSPQFDSTPRLQDFLLFVVNESLAGRRSQIKGLTIGNAVFSKGESFDPESNSIVRVEARRLRRRLDQYYMNEGRDDPVIVEIPKGTYAPNFVLKSKEKGQSQFRSFSPLWLLALVSLVILTLVFLAITWRSYSSPARAISGESETAFSGDRVPEAESQILFKQAFNLLMPPEDAARLEASKALFERVIKIDPTFGGGYSGLSIALAFQVLFIKSNDPDKDKLESLAMAEKAVAVDPNIGLGHSALAIALVLSGDTEKGVEQARHSLTMKPPSANAYAMAALAVLLAGNSDAAIELLSKAIKLNPDEPRTPYLNLLAIAQYDLRDYSGAVDSMEENLERGGPTGPHMDVFLAASYVQLGKNFSAGAIIDELQKNYPDFPVEEWMANFIFSELHMQETIEKLNSLENLEP